AFARLVDAGLALLDLLERCKRGVVLVGEPGGQGRAAWTGVAAHDQRRMRSLYGLWLGAQSRQRVVLAVERELVLAPRPHQDLELPLEHVHAGAGGLEWKPVRLVLTLVPARADAQVYPAARDVVG